MHVLIMNLLGQWQRFYLWWCLPPLVFLFASCALVEPMYPPHIVVTRNVGVGNLSDVVIDYGKTYVLRDSTPSRPGRVRDNGVLAPVPEVMRVSWRTAADGKQHTASVPLRSRITYVEKLKGFELLFYDDRLEVYHLTSTGNKDEFEGRKRIFPE